MIYNFNSLLVSKYLTIVSVVQVKLYLQLIESFNILISNQTRLQELGYVMFYFQALGWHFNFV